MKELEDAIERAALGDADAISWIEKTADDGDIDAISWLFDRHGRRQSEYFDPGKAKRLISSTRDQASRGDASAIYLISYIDRYCNPFGNNEAKGAFNLKLAADLGHPGAAFELGVCHNLGMFGFEKNQELAIFYLRKAMELGSQDAREVLSTIEFHGIAK